MNTIHRTLPCALLCALLATHVTWANPANDTAPTPEQTAQALKKHAEGAQKLSTEQDELSADVQDLIDEQTDPEVIKLLREIEIVMADATDMLESQDTGGATIATETEVIEKIFEAAKKKQQKSGGSQGSQQSMGSMLQMLQMLQNMMNGGRDLGQKPGKGAGEQPGAGGGKGGESNGKTGAPDDTSTDSTRRVPKNSGTSGTTIPREFRKAMDAYNKGATQKTRTP